MRLFFRFGVFQAWGDMPVPAEGRKWFLSIFWSHHVPRPSPQPMKRLPSWSCASSVCPLVRVKLGPILIETLKGRKGGRGAGIFY